MGLNGEFPKYSTNKDLRREFEKNTGNIAVSKRGKCTFEYFKYLEELALEHTNRYTKKCYEEFGDDL